MNTTNPTAAFAARPRVLSDVVRNIVIGRAMAGAYDARETGPQAILACRAAARQKLGCQRLNPAQADEVDALVMATRAQAFENMNPTLRGAVSESTIQMFAAAPQAVAPTSGDSDTTKAILAALMRIEKMITMIITLVFDRALAARRGAEAPVLTAGSTEDAIPDTWRGQHQLPAWQGTAMVVGNQASAPSAHSTSLALATRAPVPRKDTQLARWNGTELVVYGEDVS